MAQQFHDWGFSPDVSKGKKDPTTPNKSDKEVMADATTGRSEQLARNSAAKAEEKRTGNSAMFPTYKKGGKVKKTGLAKLHKGERVLTKKQAKKRA